MNKRMTLPVHLSLVGYPEQTAFSIEFEREAVAGWCLGLCLLKEDLIRALVIQEHAASRTLEIQLEGPTEKRSRSHARLDTEVFQLRLTPNDIDYVLHFFLRYYRDGVAEVDHIDLDVRSLGSSGEATITFKVPDSLGPLDAREAGRRLGLG